MSPTSVVVLRLSRIAVVLVCLLAGSARGLQGQEAATATPPADSGNAAPDSSAQTPVTAAQQPAQSNDRVQVSVHPGGTLRYTANRWGMVKAIVTNKSNEVEQRFVVVTPPGSEGLQYGRQVSVPPRTMFETSWPVRVGRVPGGIHEFPYLAFPGGDDQGQLVQSKFEELLPTLTAQVDANETGPTGWISSPKHTFEDGRGISGLLRALRYELIRNAALISIIPQELTGQSESLDSLDALGISSPELLQSHHAVESVRSWLQRGGRLLLFLDYTGPELAEALLGDALPLTVVGETSANNVRLDLNPDFRMDRYPVRFVEREFDEPVRWLRVVFEAGEPLWLVDGWPVAVQAPVGSGQVIVTTISPDVFLRHVADPPFGAPPFSLIESSRPMVSTLFQPRTPPLLPEAAVSAQAAKAIGYEIPSQQTGAMMALLFPALLLIVGAVLVNRGMGQSLVWVVPVLGVLGAIPAVAIGMRTRAVAPETVIETDIVRAIPGQRTQEFTGYTTFYSPRPQVLDARMVEGAILESRPDSVNRDYKRQIWTDSLSSYWVNLNQPAGLRTFTTRASATHDQPLRAVATFGEQGVVGTLRSGGYEAPSDLVLAGVAPDRMTAVLEADGTFRGTPDDVLPTHQFVSGSLMTDEQRRRSALLDAAFYNKERVEPFPDVPSLMFWAEPPDSPLQIGGETARHSRTALVVLPLVFLPPEAGQRFTIPSPFLPYQAVLASDGAGSSMFSNARREWSPLESGSESVLQFNLPRVCLPFVPESAVVDLVIRAGSRTVVVSAGPQESMTRVAEYSSPLGSQRIELPVELISDSCSAGHVFLGLQVSDMDPRLKSSGATGEQDDSWTVERLQLTLRGKRLAAVAEQAASIAGATATGVNP